jgi:hypothetical protein
MNQQQQNKVFEQVQNNQYTFCQKISAFFNHLRIMLFATGEERRVYANTFESYKKWKEERR